MLCDNCGKKQANVKYSENINGRKKELNLCEECSKKLGINHIDFSIPIDFSSFFGEVMEDFGTSEFMPLFNEMKALKCKHCGYTFEDITSTGKLGCGDCYETFEERLSPIIRRIQGANTHIGRSGKIIDNRINQKLTNQSKQEENTNQENVKKEESQLEKLQEKLKQAIKEEKYEDAAKIRDEIKKIQKGD